MFQNSKSHPDLQRGTLGVHYTANCYFHWVAVILECYGTRLLDADDYWSGPGWLVICSMQIEMLVCNQLISIYSLVVDGFGAECVTVNERTWISN